MAVVVPEYEESFGARLRRLRGEAGLSLADMARATHYSRGYLSKVENGGKPPNAGLARICDEALGAGGALLSLVPDQAADEVMCPYPGLVPFGSSQARWFFGRERATAALVNRLAERRHKAGPLVVVGPSGAGKSSLLHAGLVPALTRGALPMPGSQSWPVLSLTPTAHPTRELVTGLTKATGLEPDAADRALEAGPGAFAVAVREAMRETGLVLLIDQFEELFTVCEDEQDRRAFVGAVCALASAGPLPPGEQPPILLIIGVRADFYGHCLAYPELVTALDDGQVPLGPMSHAELREAITGPAREAGLELEPGLVEVLLSEVGSQDGPAPCPGAGVLPLLAHALLATWQERENGRMTVSAYRRTGGIKGAVAASAERVYLGLDGDGRAAVRQVLLRLVRVGEDDQDTRRRVDRARLMSLSPDPGAAARVLDAFAAARLITLDADYVEIAHEALLYAWPRLRGWIDADRAGLRSRQRLLETAEAWESSGHDPALLYRGTQLALALDWMGGRPGDLSLLEHRFLQAAERRRQADLTAQRRRTRRLRRLVALLSVLVLLAGGATGFAVRQRSMALTQRDLAAAQVAVDQAERLRQVDPSLAMKLSLAAHRLVRSPQTRGAVIASSGSVFSTRLPGHRYSVRRAAFHGTTLVTAGNDGLVLLNDVRAPRRPATTTAARVSGEIGGMAISSDGRLVAGGGEDRTVTVRSLRDPRSVVFSAPLDAEVSALAFAPNGRTLGAATTDGAIRLWDMGDPARPAVRVPRDADHGTRVNGLAFSPDGRTLASAGDDHTVRLWDVTRPLRPTLCSVLRRHEAQVRSVAFAPDGRLLASTSFDRTVRLTELPQPCRPGPAKVLTGHTNLVNDVVFRADGRQIATAGDDQTARLWEVSSGREVMTLPQPNPVRSVAFGQGGATLATGDDEGRLLLWHLPPPAVLAPAGGLWTVRYAPARGVMATGGVGAAHLWDVSRSRQPFPLATLRHGAAGGTVDAVAFDAGGRLLVTGGQDRTARLWDISDPRRPYVLGTVRHTAAIYTAAVSGDGRLLVTGGEDHAGRLWDISDPRRPRALGTVRHTDRVNGVALTSDARVLVTVGGDYQARIWDISDRRRPVVLAVLPHPNQVNNAALGPGGRILATTADDRRTRLWDIGDPRRPVLLSTLVGHREASRGVSFTPDGRTLVTTADDRTAHLWDIGDPRRPTSLTPLSGHTRQVTDVAVSPDGRTITTVGADSVLRLWTNDVTVVSHWICALDGPGLTPTEWAAYFPDQPFQRSCGR
ncbi:nSTAND1 domain-containing NTPase [Thermomonospora echinospora]|uniref:nSTAND1 domain-containing NTPase n=1 Tax=Thermomonospora echinospora TaxID=1992 RepID=UPI00135CE37C|nr:helix-turn-helix domain-containing protein [Thermomonospora echinospora]